MNLNIVFVGLLLLVLAALTVMYYQIYYITPFSAILSPAPLVVSQTFMVNNSLPVSSTRLLTPAANQKGAAFQKNHRACTEVPVSAGSPLATPAANQTKVLCIRLQGRLGNQLFQYASGLGLAQRLGRVAVYISGPSLTSALQHPPPKANAEQLGRCKKARVCKEKVCCGFNKAFLHLDPKADYRVGSYLQSWKYFEGAAEAEVRKAIVFKEDVRQQANRTIEKLRGKCNRTLIGVHVRRGDYLTRPFRIGYRTPPADYYRKAMTYLRRRFGRVTFLVSVDNKNWFLTSVTSASDVIVLKRQAPPVDMALLASLDHVITSVGTYSWWVGYLNEGVTVYWKDFIAKGTLIGNGFEPNGNNFIYPGWIPF